MSLKSLVATGTKVWLDSVDPKEVEKMKPLGISGATSNPIIISDIIKAGGLDDQIAEFIKAGDADDLIAWKLTDHLVRSAQEAFRPVWEKTQGDDGYVSFELDPLLEDVQNPTPTKVAAARYVELAKKWSAGHDNRMIKIPATEAGLAALEEVAAAGITINVTLVFSERQYKAARDAVWRGAQQREDVRAKFKSVYSIFISRVDVYTEKYVPELSKDAQGKVGLLNAKEMWSMNQEFWSDKSLHLKQEIIFASTGKKLKWQAEDYYVENLAGSDIQTNPPATNDAIERLNKTYGRTVDLLPSPAIVNEIHQKADQAKMEAKLMEEGTLKFADPQKALLKLIAEKRGQLTAAK